MLAARTQWPVTVNDRHRHYWYKFQTNFKPWWSALPALPVPPGPHHKLTVTGDGAITQLPACFRAILKNRRHRQLESVWTTVNLLFNALRVFPFIVNQALATGIKQGWQEVNKNR
jgi:hypothetical protein